MRSKTPRKPAPQPTAVPENRTAKPKPEAPIDARTLPPAFVSVADEVAELLFYGTIGHWLNKS